MNFQKRMLPVETASFFDLTDQGFHVWCGSIAKSDEGLFYIYFSFWPMDRGFDAWVTHSQIGYAVSESPLGPFRFQGIALSGAGGDEWDGDCVHNPVILKVKGKYYLYYMGTHGCSGDWWDYRNHQRIGVAWSDRPEGPFRRFAQPLLDVRPGFHDSLALNNPTVCVGPDGKIHMVYKAISDQGEPPVGGAVVCGTAVAEDPLGPFRRSDAPIFCNPENNWSVEDPFLWYEDGAYHALAKDFQGYFTKAEKQAVALFTSRDFTEWQLDESPLAYELMLTMKDGTKRKMAKMERPQMWLSEDGHPAVLCCACAFQEDSDLSHTFNVQIGIR